MLPFYPMRLIKDNL